MELAMIGLGKMGGNMARRLLKGGIRVVGLNRSEGATRQLAKEAGLVAAYNTAECGEIALGSACGMGDGAGRRANG